MRCGADNGGAGRRDDNGKAGVRGVGGTTVGGGATASSTDRAGKSASNYGAAATGAKGGIDIFRGAPGSLALQARGGRFRLVATPARSAVDPEREPNRNCKATSLSRDTQVASLRANDFGFDH